MDMNGSLAQFQNGSLGKSQQLAIQVLEGEPIARMEAFQKTLQSWPDDTASDPARLVNLG